MNGIPQFLTGYNIYTNGNQLVGVSGDITLPKLDNIGDTISGAGIMGEFETPVPGSYKSLTMEVGFRVIDKTMFELMSQAGVVPLTFRAAQQINDYTQSPGITQEHVRIETRGGFKGMELGKAAPGKATDSKITQEILFMAIYIAEKEVLFLDKLNYIYRVNGVDLTADIRAAM